MLLELSVSVKGKAVDEGSVNMSRIIDQSGLHYRRPARDGSGRKLGATDGRCQKVPRRSAEDERPVCDADEGRRQEGLRGTVGSGSCGKQLEDVLEDEGEWLML